MEIVVDTREQHGPITLVGEKVKEYNEYIKNTKNTKLREIKWHSEQLPIGDFLIKHDDIIKIIFERKTWKDLAASIVDQRANSQLLKMTEYRKKTNCVIIYIIEGKKPRFDKVAGVNLNALQTKIRQISLKSIHCIYTQSVENTVETLIAYCKDLLSTQIIVAGDEEVLVDVNTQNEIYNAKTIHTVDEQQFNVWYSIPGIGEKTAKLLHSVVSLGEYLRADKIEEKRIINKIVAEKDAQNLRLGPAVMQTINTLKSVHKDSIFKKQYQQMAVNILKSIQGVGPVTAEKLSNKFTLVELANFTDVDLLSETILTANNGKQKKLGKAAAQKIIDVLK